MQGFIQLRLSLSTSTRFQEVQLYTRSHFQSLIFSQSVEIEPINQAFKLWRDERRHLLEMFEISLMFSYRNSYASRKLGRITTTAINKYILLRCATVFKISVNQLKLSLSTSTHFQEVQVYSRFQSIS